MNTKRRTNDEFRMCAESNANDELGVLNKGLCQFTLHWVGEKREMFETTRCSYEHAGHRKLVLSQG